MLFDGSILVMQVTEMQHETVARWHEKEMDNPYDDFLGVVCQQHQFNYLLWHEEDIARSRDVTDQQIAGVKRAIDGYNQQRNDWIERVDEFLLHKLDERGIVPRPDATLNTETPGSAIDRLSIMSLRMYHMQEQVDRVDASEEHRQKAMAKLQRCKLQHADLSSALADLLNDVFAGVKHLKIYRQMKMYNDPTLNPYLYGKRKAG